MDREILRLFGLDQKSVQEFDAPPYDEAKEFVPDIWINGKRLLRRWTLTVSGVHVMDTKNGGSNLIIKGMLQDEMTGKIGLKPTNLRSVTQNMEDRSVHVELERNVMPGDFDDYFHLSRSWYEWERNTYLKTAAGELGEYELRVAEAEEEQERSRKCVKRMVSGRTTTSRDPLSALRRSSRR